MNMLLNMLLEKAGPVTLPEQADTYRVRFVLITGESCLTEPLGDHETASRWALSLRQCRDVVAAEAEPNGGPFP
ncbi:MAG TPA: hypothetical protein VK395_07635 [Gemmataceae bacterium]|nr:hypothetical protein [Gemmataceae bacterium]